MADKDQHGLIITLVSVSVVFAALILLYFAYTLTGKITNGSISLKRRKNKDNAEKPSDEIAAVIGLALQEHFNESVHDEESYIITIRRSR